MTDSIPDSCNYDLTKFSEYLGHTVNMIVYSNTPRFLQDKYGNERLKKESSLTTLTFNAEKVNKNSV